MTDRSITNATSCSHVPRSTTPGKCQEGGASENANARIVPSLQYIALKRVHEKNPVKYEKFIAQYDYIFEDLDLVLKEEKDFKEFIYNQVISRGGRVHGGAIRDEINHEFYRDLDIFFQYPRDLQCFLENIINEQWLNEQWNEQWLIVSDEMTKDYFASGKVIFRKIKIIARRRVDILNNYDLSMEHLKNKRKACNAGVIQRYHTIDVILDITSLSEDPQEVDEFYYLQQDLDFDVNQLYYYGKHTAIDFKVPMKMSLPEIRKQILRKEFKVICGSDSFLKENESYRCIHRYNSSKILERKLKMEQRGWKCINKPCRYAYCIFSPEELFKAQYKKDVYEREINSFVWEQRTWLKEIKKQDEEIMKKKQPLLKERKEWQTEKFEKKLKSKKIKDEKRSVKMMRRISKRKIESVL